MQHPGSIVYRKDLPNGGVPFTGQAAVSQELKRQILEIDKDLELHASGRRVFMYRRTRSSGSISPMDRLVEQFELKWPPGGWLVRCLQECDQWNKYKTPERATKKQVQLYSEADARRAARYDAVIREMSEQAGRDVAKFYGRGHRTVQLGG